MVLSKDFIRKDVFANDLFFYRKFIVRLFKLIKAFSLCANYLVPSFPIDFVLNFY